MESQAKMTSISSPVKSHQIISNFSSKLIQGYSNHKQGHTSFYCDCLLPCSLPGRIRRVLGLEIPVHVFVHKPRRIVIRETVYVEIYEYDRDHFFKPGTDSVN